MAEPEPDSAGRRERMRTGVAGVVRRAGARLKTASAPSLISLLAAGAIAPIVAADETLLVASAAVVGSVGANVLTEVVRRAIDKIDTGAIDEAAAEQSLAAEIEAMLVRQDEAGETFRAELAALLQEIGAMQVALAVSVESGDVVLRDALLTAFADVAQTVSDVREAVGSIQEVLRRQDAERRVDRERARDDGVALRLVLDKVSSVETRIRSSPAPVQANSASRGVPFLGLAPFEERHTDFFYGRQKATAQLMQRLSERLTGLGLLVVIGPSGAGKSSLLRAGLVPRLAAGDLVEGSGRWPVRVLTPTDAPLRELAVQLADLAGVDAASSYLALETDPRQSALLARQAVAGLASSKGRPRARPVLIVDQFEELFTLIDHTEPQAQDRAIAFVDALAALASPQGGPRETAPAPALVVLSVRGDYLDRALAFATIREAEDAGTFRVDPMSEAELRLAITGPPAEVEVEVEPDLIDAVLHDLRDARSSIAYDVGVLPLLSQAMFAAWEQRSDGPLTVRAYRRGGGVAGAVQAGADAVYDGLDDAGKRLSHQVFTQLAVVGEDGVPARRRSSRADLRASLGAEVDDLLERYAAKRLLTLSEHDVEISHDALFQAWQQLREWLEGDVTERAVREQLIRRADSWADSAREPSRLYRGAELSSVVEIAARWVGDDERHSPLPLKAVQFLSTAQRAQKRSMVIRRLVAGALALTTVTALVGAWVAMDNAVEADRQHALALSRQLATQSQITGASLPASARQLAATAFHLAPTREAQIALATLLAQQRGLMPHAGPVSTVAFRPDGRMLASAGDDLAVRRWDPHTGSAIGAPLAGHTKPIRAVAFSGDGRMLAAGGDDGTVRLWDADTGQLRAVLSGHTRAVAGVAFRRGDRMLASIDLSGTVRFWDPAGGHEISRTLQGAKQSFSQEVGRGLAFSPDGSVLAVIRDADVSLWNPDTRWPIRTLPGPTGPAVTALAFSPDGRTLATAISRSVFRWDLRTGQRATTGLTGHTDTVMSLAFSPDGQVLASASLDGAVRRWRTSSWTALGPPMTGHSAAVLGVTFSPDSTTIASAGQDRLVRLWSTATGQTLNAPQILQRSGLAAVTFSPDGKLLATAGNSVQLREPITGAVVNTGLPEVTIGSSDVAFSRNGQAVAYTNANLDAAVIVWDTTRRRLISKHSEAEVGAMTSVAISDNADIVITGGDDGTVRRWNAGTGTPIGQPLTGHIDTVTDVAYTGASDIIASAGNDGTVRLWSAATGQPIGSPIIGHAGALAVVTFSPDGRRIAAAGARSVQIFDTATRRLERSWKTTGAVRSLSFDPRGELLATAQIDGSVQLWQTATGESIGIPLTGRSGAATGVAFSPDGRLLATVGDDGTLRIWNPAVFADPEDAICHLHGPMSARDWTNFAPSEEAVPLCRE